MSYERRLRRLDRIGSFLDAPLMLLGLLADLLSLFG